MTKSACTIARGLLAVPVLAGTLLAPESAVAQELGYYVRLAPGFAWTTVEHTKEVSVGQIIGASITSSSSAELSMHLSGGFRGEPRRQWFLGLEVEAIIYAPRSIEGEIEPVSPDAPGGIDIGMWEYTNKNGMGFNIVLERALTRSGQRLVLFAGVHRMRTEVASGGLERTGAFAEDRDLRSRWPFTGGAGAAWGPMHLRVSYFRSLMPWDFLQPELELRYRWRASGVSASLGVEVF
ncbi:MAG: hypothetical protein OXL34_03790 [Gemmatimonadota bacterium]|nr:hypothetical protein [Gemmatimonadota bacterium]